MKLFALVVILVTVLFPIYAFASSGSGEQASGEGAVEISGWTVSNIHYQPANDPAFVKSVSFDLDAPAGTVSIKVTSQATAYTNCTNLTAYHWQCDFASGISLTSMDELRVIAVGN